MNKGTNPSLMRIKNEKIILSLINRAPVSRVEIAEKTGLTKAAVTIIVDDLKKRGIVNEKNIKSGGVGRNPVMLYLNGDSVYNIGVNITRTDITVGIVNLCGKVVTEDVFSICSPSSAFPKIKGTIENQLKKTKIDKAKIRKISVVTPGPVDTINGEILKPTNFEDWHNVSVVDEMQKITDFEVIFDNVSSGGAMAEKYFGSAKNAHNFMALLVDEGVGSGIVIDDVLFKGPTEIGHISIKYNGVKCGCGCRGCLEKYAAIPEVLKNTKYKTWEDVADNNDVSLMETEADYLSSAIIAANNIFNLDEVVICGELTYKPDMIIKLISERIKESIFLKNGFVISSGRVKSKSQIAASLAIHDFFV